MRSGEAVEDVALAVSAMTSILVIAEIGMVLRYGRRAAEVFDEAQIAAGLAAGRPEPWATMRRVELRELREARALPSTDGWELHIHELFRAEAEATAWRRPRPRRRLEEGPRLPLDVLWELDPEAHGRAQLREDLGEWSGRLELLT